LNAKRKLKGGFGTVPVCTSWGSTEGIRPLVSRGRVKVEKGERVKV